MDNHDKIVENNIRFQKLAMNVYWEEELPKYNEDGLRKIPSGRIGEVGDIVVWITINIVTS